MANIATNNNGRPTGAAAKFAGRRVRSYHRPYGRWMFHPALRDGRFNRRDVPAMLQDNAVSIGLYTIYGPLFGAQFEVRANSKEIKTFVENTIYRFWHHDLRKVVQHYITTGTAIAEVMYEQDLDTGLWHYAGMDDFDLDDVQALVGTTTRRLAGVRVSSGGLMMAGNYTPVSPPPTHHGNGDAREWNVIRPPKVFWCAQGALCRELFGESSFKPAWNPWMEKVGAHGAISIRKLWAFSNAFRGCLVKYPPGSTRRDDGTIVDNQDIAREMAEAYCTGAALFCPSGTDEQGKPLWEIVDPQLNGEIRGLMGYPDALDRAIWQGMGVLDEVINAPDTGGSWSGRSGPLLIFLNICDMRVRELITAFDVGPSGYTTRSDQSGGVIRPLVIQNFGPGAKYEIRPISLVPKPAEPGAGGTPGSAPAGATGAPKQEPVGPGPGAAMGKPPQPAGQRPVQLSAADAGVELPDDAVAFILGGIKGYGEELLKSYGGTIPGTDGWLRDIALSACADLCSQIDKAAADADPHPTDAQKASGTYKKGHCTIQGLPITIENARGSTRRGIGKDGKPWSVKMKNHYGYIKRTESEADGDHVDVFIGQDPESEIVFVIDQNNQEGAFDEHKCMVGWTNAADAKEAYLANYSAGWKGFAAITAMPMSTFKEWIKTGDTGIPIEGQTIRLSSGSTFTFSTGNDPYAHASSRGIEIVHRGEKVHFLPLDPGCNVGDVYREAARLVESIKLSGGLFDETKHPRGQPENAGQFGPGRGSTDAPPPKPKHGERAAGAHAKYHELIAQARAARVEAFHAVKADAEQSLAKAAEHTEGVGGWTDDIAWDSDEDESFNELESLCSDYDEDWSIGDRFSHLKEIEAKARECLDAEQTVMTPDEAEAARQAKAFDDEARAKNTEIYHFTLARNALHKAGDENALQEFDAKHNPIAKKLGTEIAAATAKADQLREGIPEVAIAPEDAAQNKVELKQIIGNARAARSHMKAYVQHRKEMQAIKEGSPMDVQLSMAVGSYDDIEVAGEIISLAAARAPEGYSRERPLTIAGHNYVGGQYIPAHVVSKASQAEKAKLKAGPPSQAGMAKQHEEAKRAKVPNSSREPEPLTPEERERVRTLGMPGAPPVSVAEPVDAKPVSSARKLADAAAAAHHYVHDTAAAGFEKLPKPVQAAVKTTLAVAFAGWSASQALAERVSREKGATPEQASQTRSTLAAWDLVAFKPVAMATAPLGGAVAAATWVVPPVTAVYLAHAAVMHPLATIRAASGIVKDAAAKVSGVIKDHTVTLSAASPPDAATSIVRRVHAAMIASGELSPMPEPRLSAAATAIVRRVHAELNESQMHTAPAADPATVLVGALERHEWNDWYSALLHAAMLETKDAARAVQVADRAFAEHPTDPSSPRDDDAAALFAKPDVALSSKDKSGHLHKDKGKGGGQFTSGESGGGSKDSPSAGAPKQEDEDKSPLHGEKSFPKSPPAENGDVIPSMPGLSDADRAIEATARKKALTDYPKLREGYLAPPEIAARDADGNLKSVCVNTDEWRHLFDGYTGTNAAAVHEPASYCNKKLLGVLKEQMGDDLVCHDGLLKEMRGKGNNKLALYAGGGGSGKGTAIGQFFNEAEYPIRLDQVSDSFNKASDMFDKAKANGFQPEYVFVDRKPKDAYDGVVGRAINARKKGKLARTVPIGIAMKGNIDARKAAVEILQKRTDVTPFIIDNRDQFKRRLIEDRGEAIAYLQERITEDEGGIEAHKHAAKQSIAERHLTGEIDEDIARGLLGDQEFEIHRDAAKTRQAAGGATATRPADAGAPAGGAAGAGRP